MDIKFDTEVIMRRHMAYDIECHTPYRTAKIVLFIKKMAF